ncbi:MAG: hypothetical protein ACRDM7_16295, partial [Thermoleophilaceae bacterium]
DSQGRRVVEPKAETKRRLGRSPDRADAVLMAFAEGRTPEGPGPLREDSLAEGVRAVLTDARRGRPLRRGMSL